MEKNWVLDAHNDSCYTRQTFKDLQVDLPFDPQKYFKVTFPLLKKGHVKCMFVNVGDMDLLNSSILIDQVYHLQEAESVSLCFDQADVYRSVEKDKLALILACESSFLFLQQIDLLKNWYRLGIRVLSLTHGEGQESLGNFAEMTIAQNKIINHSKKMALQISETPDCYLELSRRNEKVKYTGGLTKFGKKVLDEIEKLDMLVDLSHANDATFWETLEYSDAKICCTHSNCATICNHTRNLTDEMMEALASQGGVMGLCFYGEFIHPQKPTLKLFVEHILHALDVMGVDHVGIGTDYDGVPPDCFMALENPGEMSKLWEALTEAGIKKSTQRKIAHQNFLNLL